LKSRKVTSQAIVARICETIGTDANRLEGDVYALVLFSLFFKRKWAAQAHEMDRRDK
jgi:hypothetical protein